jgi:hypothetical protein
MNFLANNVTVLGLSDQLDGEPAEQSQTEKNEIQRMKQNEHIYQVDSATHFCLKCA